MKKKKNQICYHDVFDVQSRFSSTHLQDPCSYEFNMVYNLQMVDRML